MSFLVSKLKSTRPCEKSGHGSNRSTTIDVFLAQLASHLKANIAEKTKVDAGLTKAAPAVSTAEGVMGSGMVIVTAGIIVFSAARGSQFKVPAVWWYHTSIEGLHGSKPQAEPAVALSIITTELQFAHRGISVDDCLKRHIELGLTFHI
jgi:hypothetical protein